jgi:hypothetical protein
MDYGHRGGGIFDMSIEEAQQSSSARGGKKGGKESRFEPVLPLFLVNCSQRQSAITLSTFVLQDISNPENRDLSYGTFCQVIANYHQSSPSVISHDQGLMVTCNLVTLLTVFDSDFVNTLISKYL